MDDEQQKRWQDFCYRMAEAAYSMAECCEEVELMGHYIRIGARWVRRSRNHHLSPRFQ
jgi:hypothetical protein